MSGKLQILLVSLMLSLFASGQSYSKRGQKSSYNKYILAISMDGGYSTRTTKNSNTFLNTLRNNIKYVSYNGYKVGLQVLITANDDEYALNILSAGIRGDYFNLAGKDNHTYPDNISAYFIGIVSGGMCPINKSAKSYIKIDLSIGYTQTENSLITATQKNKVSGSGLGLGISLYLSFELSKHLYLHIGGDILQSKINSNIKTTPTIALNRVSENVVFTTALMSVSKHF